MSDPDQNPHQGSGHLMLYAGWLIILGLLAYLFDNWEETRINPNRNVETRIVGESSQVVLKRSNNDHYMLNAQVNGETITFLIDTGASQLVFTPEQAQRAGLIPGNSYYVGTANGNVQVQSTVVEQLRIGDIELSQVPAAINPNMDGFALLGMSALSSLHWRQTGDELIIETNPTY
jgi:aspartyl protease family protein